MPSTTPVPGNSRTESEHHKYESFVLSVVVLTNGLDGRRSAAERRIEFRDRLGRQKRLLEARCMQFVRDGLSSVRSALPIGHSTSSARNKANRKKSESALPLRESAGARSDARGCYGINVNFSLVSKSRESI